MQYANSATLGNSVPRDQSSLDSALSGQANHIAELDTALEQLEMRLCAVLRPVPPQPAGDSKALTGVNTVQSPAVDMLHALGSRLESLTNRVNGIASRFD